MRRYLSYKTIICIAALAFVVSYDDHSVFDSIKQNRTVDSLHTELEAIRDTTELYRELNSRLQSDPELIEAVVREEYGMRRTGEDVYLFVEENEQQ